VRLITAHRILIGAAIGFGVFFTVWGVVRFTRTGDPGQLVLAAITAFVTGALTYYLKNLSRFVK
jgi:hypothetical protein